MRPSELAYVSPYNDETVVAGGDDRMELRRQAEGIAPWWWPLAGAA